MLIKLFTFLLLFSVTCISCGDKKNDKNPWLIPEDEVHDGGPGKDGIPALEHPDFVDPGNATYLEPDDLVLGYKVGNLIRAYPHAILDWHEIVNDDVGSERIAVTYCPLTGTGITWDRTVNGTVTTFGVSGLLYNSNLIPYDRSTESNWSQIRQECVNGTLIENTPDQKHTVETTWATWQAMYPNTTVIGEETGHSRSYGSYPYSDYRTNQASLLFPIDKTDTRLPTKERVLGVIINGQAKAYSLELFADTIETIHNTFQQKQLVIIGSKRHNFVLAFESTLADGTALTFKPIQNELPVIVIDQEGNKWDAFGEALEGPRKGTRLKTTNSFMGYWFSWGAFYHDLELYER